MGDDASAGGVTPPTVQHDKRFAAFISYSHRDEEFGDWLHKRLEGYRVPSPLVGRVTSAGVIGKKLGKVFRDRADLSAAHDLGREIREGLESADALIVLCSPRSCGSKYVHEEIRTFKALGKGQRIFAAILDGEPHAAGRPGYTAADECFPPSLIYALGRDGQISPQLEPNEPIAADFREGKDGRENGSLKIIAGLLDVGLDELVQREKQAERRRRLRANAIAAAMGVLALGAMGAGGVAWFARQDAIEQRDEARRQRTIAEERENARALAAEEARIQELAARRGEADAQVALIRMFADRSREAVQRSQFWLAARYSLAGWRLTHGADGIDGWAPDPINDAEFAAALGGALHQANEAREMRFANAEIYAHNAETGSIAVVNREGAVEIWDVANGRRRLVLPRHGVVKSVTFSPDGARIVTTVDDEKEARVWSARDGELQTILRVPEGEFVRVAPMSDGQRAVVLLNDAVRQIWDISSNEARMIREFESGADVFGFEFSADESRVIVVRREEVRVFDTSTWTQVATLRGHTRRGVLAGSVASARLNADGSRAVTAGTDGLAMIWDLSPGIPDEQRRLAVLTPIRETPENDRTGFEFVWEAAFSPDGTRVVTAAETSGRIWDAATGAEMRTLRGQDAEMRWASFTADGRVVATDLASTVRVWDAHGNLLNVFGADGCDRGVVPRQNSGARYLIGACGDGAFRIWQAQGRHIVQGRVISNDEIVYHAYQQEMEFNADGTRLIWNQRALFDAASGDVVTIPNGVEAIAPDGRYVTTDDDRRVQILAEGRAATVLRETRGASSFYGVFSADSSRLFIGLRGWDTRSGAPVATLPPHLSDRDLRRGTLSSNGARLIFRTDENGATVWDTRAGRSIARLATNEVLETFALSADGRRAITAPSYIGGVQEDDTIATLWDVATQRALVTLRGHAKKISALAFSRDGRRVATGSEDRSIIIWDTVTGRQIARLVGHSGEIAQLAFSADGSRLAAMVHNRTEMIIESSGVSITTLHVWDTSRLTGPLPELARAACRALPNTAAHHFSDLEIAADPLLREIWVADGRTAQTDVCAGLR